MTPRVLCKAAVEVSDISPQDHFCVCNFSRCRHRRGQQQPERWQKALHSHHQEERKGQDAGIWSLLWVNIFNSTTKYFPHQTADWLSISFFSKDERGLCDKWLHWCCSCTFYTPNHLSPDWDQTNYSQDKYAQTGFPWKIPPRWVSFHLEVKDWKGVVFVLE